jgi:hypothetical protein
MCATHFSRHRGAMTSDDERPRAGARGDWGCETTAIIATHFTVSYAPDRLNRRPLSREPEKGPS